MQFRFPVDFITDLRINKPSKPRLLNVLTGEMDVENVYIKISFQLVKKMLKNIS